MKHILIVCIIAMNILRHTPASCAGQHLGIYKPYPLDMGSDNEMDLL